MNRLTFITIVLFAFPAWAGEGEQGIHVDLDAVVEAGEATPVDGITSAGQPDAQALDVFAESGYAVVIDMRGPDEDRGVDDWVGTVEATGMEYVAFPLVGKDAISFENAAKLDAILEEIEGPVLLHCGRRSWLSRAASFRLPLSSVSRR